MHQLVIRPILGGEPINQLLVTGGVLFFLQALATLLFGIEFRNIGLSLPSVTIGDIYLPMSRIIAAGTALVAMLGVWLFLKRTYLGIAIRAISQDRAIMPLMGVDAEPHLPASPRRSAAGWPASAPACWCCSTTSTRRSACRFGPITFMICVMGGLGNLVGGFIAAFIFAQFISVGGFFFHLEWGYVMAFVVLHRR